MALAAALGLSVEDILHSPASDVSARPEVREGEAIAADSREVQTSVPDKDSRDQADRLFRSLLLGLLAALVLVLVIGLVACWVPAEAAARMTIRAALAYE